METEIKFNFINSLNKENQISSIDEILLSKNNPRFTIIDSLDTNLVNFIIDNTYDDIESQNEIKKELLKNEGDLSDLLRLIKSINQFGFLNKNEEILLIYNKKINKYVVAEGNRRIMLLKIISGSFDFPNEKFFSPTLYQNNNTEYTNSSEYEIENDITNKETEKNHEEFLEILEEIRKRPINWTIFYKVIDNDNANDLWSLIFDKHITGKRPGMREWNRAKYFADILSFFPNGVLDDEKLNCEKLRKINREMDVVVQDFKEAQFVYSCFYSNKYNDKETISFNDLDVMNDLKNATRISALERIHSFNKIKKICVDKFLDGDSKLFDDEFFKFDYARSNKRIIFEPKKLKTIPFLSNIFKWWENKWITTRNFKDENLENIISDLNIMINDLKTKNLLKKEELWKIDEFSLDDKKIQDIILVNKKQYENEEEVLKRFENALKIKEQNKRIKEKLKNLKNEWKDFEYTPLFSLKIFVEQANHNADFKKQYYNAMFVSIRSFFELLILFVSYFVVEEENKKEKIIECISTAKEISKKRTELFNELYKDDEKNEYEKNRKMFKKNLFKENVSDTEFLNEVDNFLWNINNWHFINNPIHGYHKIYVFKNYNEIFEKFIVYLEMLIFILKNINLENFKKLNNEIKEKIDAENKKISN